MNFNRLNYDTCTYQHNLKQSVGVADYVLGMPRINCHACFHADPSMGPIDKLPAVRPRDALVDLDSELMGLNRKASNCPTTAHIPDIFKPDEARLGGTTTPIADCRAISVEETRLSNPPSTLREQGWNRWELLWENPQTRAEVPFRFNVSNRLIVKDNHRPCIPAPINQSHVLPPHNGSDAMITYDAAAACGQVQPSLPRAQYWDTCNALKKII